MRAAVAFVCSSGVLIMSACMTIPGAPSPGGISSGSANSSFGMSSFGSSSGYSSTNSATNSYGSTPAPSSAGPPSEPADSSVPPGYANNAGESGSLSNYLQSHKLPLVGAQVLTNSNGNKQVILYGFVATDFGKQDAANKARRYLNSPDTPVINRIQVRPELAAGNNGSGSPAAGSSGTYGSSGSADSPELGSAQAYQQQQQQAEQQQQYMQQNQATAGALSSLMPLIGMMGMLSMGSGGVGIGIDAQQLHPRAGGAEHPLGLKHGGRGQRADRRALGVGEGQQDHLSAEAMEGYRPARLVGQREVRCGSG